MAFRVLAIVLFMTVQTVWAADQAPGYGVVQSITRLPPSTPAERSASTGSSSTPAKRKTVYLVRVKMDDGSYQVREVAGVGVRVGQRVLVTNAGDVLPD